jgi:putative transposase
VECGDSEFNSARAFLRNSVTVHLIPRGLSFAARLRHNRRAGSRAARLRMARLARVVLPGLPHHVTQRGNGRQRTFFSDDDYGLYRDLLREHCGKASVAVWSWVLMPNHVHLVLVPSDEDGLRRALAPLHRAYAGRVHERLKRTGHFWQGRFGCVAMDEAHAQAAIVYGLMNPVRAGLARRASDWRWSSIHALLGSGEDLITDVAVVRERLPDLEARLAAGEEAEAIERLRRAESIGRPLGDAAFMAAAERLTGRRVAPEKRGRKRQAPGERPEISALSP